MAKSIKVGTKRVGVSKSKRADGKGSVVRIYTYTSAKKKK